MNSTEENMTEVRGVDPGTDARALIPTGELGIRGRELSLDERARIFDELFFEDERRARTGASVLDARALGGAP